MEDLLTGILSSAGVCGGLLVYYLLQIKPELRAYQQSQADEGNKMREQIQKMVDAMNTFSRVRLMMIATSHDVHAELKEAAQQEIDNIDEEKK